MLIAPVSSPSSSTLPATLTNAPTTSDFTVSLPSLPAILLSSEAPATACVERPSAAARLHGQARQRRFCRVAVTNVELGEVAFDGDGAEVDVSRKGRRSRSRRHSHRPQHDLRRDAVIVTECGSRWSH
jgi:hypothetical protein